MIEPQRAPVVPRVLSPDTGDAVPLEEAISPLADRPCGAVEIVGGPGSGKTTALRHLAAVLGPDDRVLLLDEPDPGRAAAEGKTRLVVYTSATPHLAIAAESLYLVSWGDDELIEHCLAVHPEQCRSVMGRVRGAEHRRRLQGIPQLWRIVLDEMAKDPALADLRDALRRHLQSLVPDDKGRVLAGRYCLAAIVGDESRAATGVFQLTRLDYGETLIRLLRHRLMRVLLAADGLNRRLIAADASFLAKRLPRDLVEETALQAVSSPPALANLGRFVGRRNRAVHAMAASLLHATGSGWVPGPPGRRVPHLAGAYFEGASWPGVDLSRAELGKVDLIAADLTEAKLDHARAREACLRHAVLHGASLDHFDARRADFCHANLSQANGRTALFCGADLLAADLEGAVLPNADFRSAKLSGARFRGGDLRHTHFEGAVVDGADFTEANLRWASFRGLNLQSVVLAGACLAEVDMTGCNLEYVDLPEAYFEGAFLTAAWLTGSSMPRANFRKARLRGAGLGGVQWEGVDLRDADLRQCSFHMGSSRSGLVGSPIPSEGSRTGFYTDEFDEQHYKPPEVIRKANLRGADLRGATIEGVDFYLVDLRDVRCTIAQMDHFRRCGAILYHRA